MTFRGMIETIIGREKEKNRSRGEGKGKEGDE
jgi:hypothetical protein